MKIQVLSARGNESVEVELQGITEREYSHIIRAFGKSLATDSPASAVADAFLIALNTCPKANPADLWWHVIYRHYLSTSTDQSWKRTAGFALERAFVKFYLPLLQPYEVKIAVLAGKDARRVMEHMGIADRVGKSKLDVVLEGNTPQGKPIPFGGVHVKSSLAERIQDDVPASQAMMQNGYWSGFVTLDAKAFPPPHGDGVVRGELGLRREKEGALKRNYFERDGQFDNCYSYNLRTLPSSGETLSGKRIYSLSFSEPKPDQFMQDVIAHWERMKPRSIL